MFHKPFWKQTQLSLYYATVGYVKEKRHLQLFYVPGKDISPVRSLQHGHQ